MNDEVVVVSDIPHELACPHWSSSGYAFCKHCFLCYSIVTGLSWNSKTQTDYSGCSGKVIGSLPVFFRDQYNKYGYIPHHEYQSEEDEYHTDAFFITALF